MVNVFTLPKGRIRPSERVNEKWVNRVNEGSHFILEPMDRFFLDLYKKHGLVFVNCWVKFRVNKAIWPID
jgi:hypothetical protein